MHMDAHCHLSLHENDVKHLVQTLRDHGINGACLGGVNASEWQRQKELKQLLSPEFRLVLAFGLHPWSIHKYSEEQWLLALAELKAALPQAELFGELGLDYAIAKDQSTRQCQLIRLEAQLALDEGATKPLVIHCVRAHNDLLERLKTLTHRPVTGLIHSFIGSKQIAKSYLDLGYFLSFSPTSLSHDRSDLLKFIPKDRVLLESDAPHHRRHQLFPSGKTAHPDSRCIFQLAAIIADIWQESSVENVLRQCDTNLMRLLPELS